MPKAHFYHEPAESSVGFARCACGWSVSRSTVQEAQAAAETHQLGHEARATPSGLVSPGTQTPKGKPRRPIPLPNRPSMGRQQQETSR